MSEMTPSPDRIDCFDTTWTIETFPAKHTDCQPLLSYKAGTQAFRVKGKTSPVRCSHSIDVRCSSSDHILKEAYEAGKSVFTELSHTENIRLWVEDQPSLDGLRQVLEMAKASYESKPTSKARKWLAIFSSKVAFYGAVLDVLSQHHPEYVSLAWGAMKFLFMVRET